MPVDDKHKDFLLKNPARIRYFEDHILDEALCLAAIKSDPHVINLINIKHRTPLVCAVAFDLDPNTFKYIPHSSQNLKMCFQSSLLSDGGMDEYINPIFKDDVEKLKCISKKIYLNSQIRF